MVLPAVVGGLEPCRCFHVLLHGEKSKAAQRLLKPPVPKGRPVLPATQHKREKLLDDFLICGTEQGLDLLGMFERHQQFIDDVSLVSERNGRALYDCGKSDAKYAETIDAITNWRPALRRLLQGAWDFGYAWNRHEPSCHHAAMPGPVALAIICTAIIWVWVQFADVIALGWAGLLRPGEMLAATRADLLLPSDGDRTLPFGLLSIRDPKTRFFTARHQSAKIDMPDMLRIVEMFFGAFTTASETMADEWQYFAQQVSSNSDCHKTANQWCTTFGTGLMRSELAQQRG